MAITPKLFPELIAAIITSIDAHADEVTELDQAIGDGDHVFNLQRGLQALQTIEAEISQLDWSMAWQKIGMSLMSSVGGASGSLYATLFISLHKNSQGLELTAASFAEWFVQAIEAVKQRGKSDAGEKTMLDVLIPVATAYKQDVGENQPLPVIFQHISEVAAAGVEATRDMLASKGRASFLGERSKGHIDAGAKTAQLMIAAIISVLQSSATPA